MLIPLKAGDEFYPRFIGWYLTSSQMAATQWENGEVIPLSDFKIKAPQAMPQNKGIVPNGSLWWVWTKNVEFPENEFGTECP